MADRMLPVARTPRIPPKLDPAPEAAAILEKVMHVDGQPLNEPRTLAWHPLLLKRFTLLAGFFLTGTTIPQRPREILTMRTIHLAGCEYLFGHHQLSAGAAGLSSGEIIGIRGPNRGWAPEDALLITAADEMWNTDTLSDEIWSELARSYDEPQLLEIVMLLGFYRMVCTFIDTLRIELEPGVPGWPRLADTDETGPRPIG